MAARFFVDENDLALAKALSERHSGVLYPGHSDLPDIPRGTSDDEWLPRDLPVGLRSRLALAVTRCRSLAA